MAVRTTMATSIARVRTLIADPAGASQIFADQDVQDALDERREDVHARPLRPVATFPAGVLSYLDYYADTGAWEDSPTLQNGGYAVVTPATSEPLVGHWTFTTSQAPPMFLTGKVYDLHGASADLLRAWAAKEKLSFDFTSSQQQQFARSQKVKALLGMASEYDARARPTIARLTRSDEAGPHEGRRYDGRLDDRGLPWGTGYSRTS